MNKEDSIDFFSKLKIVNNNENIPQDIKNKLNDIRKIHKQFVIFDGLYNYPPPIRFPSIKDTLIDKIVTKEKFVRKVKSKESSTYFKTTIVKQDIIYENFIKNSLDYDRTKAYSPIKEEFENRDHKKALSTRVKSDNLFQKSTEKRKKELLLKHKIKNSKKSFIKDVFTQKIQESSPKIFKINPFYDKVMEIPELSKDKLIQSNNSMVNKDNTPKNISNNFKERLVLVPSRLGERRSPVLPIFPLTTTAVGDILKGRKFFDSIRNRNSSSRFTVSFKD